MEAINATLRRTPDIVNLKSCTLATSKSDKNQKSFICGKYVIQYDEDSKVRLFLSKNGSCLRTITLPGKITVIEPWEDEKIIFCAFESRKTDHFGEVHLLSLNKSLTAIRKFKISSETVTHIRPVFLRPTLSHKAALHPDLIDFHGLAVFATSSGNILFVDLNIGEDHRMSPALTDLEYLDVEVISEVRNDLYKSDSCPAVFEGNHRRSQDAAISTLTVAVQQSLLLIGYEDGVVSFYALKEMRSIHESPNEDEEYGVINRIIIQEPGNDPKKVCYMWQCSQLDEQVQLEMFALEFRRRHPTKIEEKERRMFYDELVSVGHRFSFWQQGKLTSAFAVENFHEHSSDSDSWEDADIYATPSESYVFFGVEEDKFRIYMFELNGYYNARCPASLGSKSKWDRRFFSILNISVEKPEHIRIQSKFLKHFECSDRGGPLMMTECHVEDPTEPESITFTLDAIIDNFYEENIVHSRQNTALRLLKKLGNMEESANEVHKELEFARLTLNQVKKISGGYKDTYSIMDAITNLSYDEKVDSILTSALYFGHLDDLTKFYGESSTDNEKSKAYLWGKENIKRIKKRFNKLIAILYVPVMRTEQRFNRRETWKQLKVIEQLFFDLHRFYLTISNAEDYLTRGCQINQKYADVLAFLVKSSMLPETEDRSNFGWNYECIRNIYDRHRNGKEDALMIDLVVKMVEKVAHCELETWNKSMQYPPQSLKCIIDLILNIDVRPVITGSLLCYAILDILRTNDLTKNEAPVEDQIFAVLNALGMNRKLVKYIQACWFLDNGYYKEAVNSFNSGLAEPIVFTHHWTRICSILLENDHVKEAFAISSIHTPEWSSSAELLEITYLRIDIYLANKLVFECVRCIQQTRAEDPSLDWENAFIYMVKHARAQGLLRELFSCQLSYEEQQLVFQGSPDDQSTSLYRKLLSFSSPMPVKPTLKGTPHPLSRKRLQTPTKAYFSPMMRDRRNSSIFQEKDDIAQALFSSPSVLQMKNLIQEPNSYEKLTLPPKPVQSSLTNSQKSEREDRVRPIRFKSESSMECSGLDVSMASTSSESAVEKAVESNISTEGTDSHQSGCIFPDSHSQEKAPIEIIDESEEEGVLQTSLDKEIEQNNASVYDTPDVSMLRPDSVNSNKSETVAVQDESSRSSNGTTGAVTMDVSGENLFQEKQESQEKAAENGSESEEAEVLDQIQKGPTDSDLEENPSIIAIPEMVKNPDVERVGAELRKDTSMDGDRMTVSDTESMAQEDHLLLRRHTVHMSASQPLKVMEEMKEDQNEKKKDAQTEIERVKEQEEQTGPVTPPNDKKYANMSQNFEQEPAEVVEKEVESFEVVGKENDQPVIPEEEPFVEVEMVQEPVVQQEPVKQSSCDEDEIVPDSEMPALEPVLEMPEEETVAEKESHDLPAADEEGKAVDDEVAELTKADEDYFNPVDQQSGLTKSELLQKLNELEDAEPGDLRKLHKVFFNKMAVVSKTTRATYEKKIRKHIEDRLAEIAPGAAPSSRSSSRASTSSRKRGTTPKPVEKQKKAAATPKKSKSSPPSRVDTPLRRSSRIRNKSESDMSGNESDASVSSIGSARSNKSTKSTGSRAGRRTRKPSAAKALTLKPVPENEEPLFSPPRALSKSQPKDGDQENVEPIPFSFSTPSKRGRKRSVDDLEDAAQSPAKAPRKSASQPVTSELVANEPTTPLRRSSRSRRGSSRSQN